MTRPTCLSFVIILLAAGSHLLAQPLAPAADEIPPLAPALPEIPPTLWEQFGWTLWLLIPLVLVMMAVIVWLALRPGKPPVLVPPAAQARAALQALQAQPETGATLSQVSQVVRHYLINSFWLTPLATTTSEFCGRLSKCDLIGPQLAAVLSEFLRQCDDRKFSPASNPAPLGAAGRALELVEQIEARRLAICASIPECGGPPTSPTP